MTLRDRLPEIGVAAVGLYAAGRLTGVIGGGGGDTADPVSQGGPSGGDRNTTGSDDRPQITVKTPGFEQFLEYQRERRRGGARDSPTNGDGSMTDTTAASDTTDTDPTGGDTGTTSAADTNAGDDRNAVATPGDLGDGDGGMLGELFSGGLSSSPSGDRNVTGDPGSTSATDDRNAVGEQTQRPDSAQTEASSTTQRPDTRQTEASGGGQLGGFDPADVGDDDDRGGGGGGSTDSTSSSESDSGGSSVADSFSGGLKSGIAGDN